MLQMHGPKWLVGSDFIGMLFAISGPWYPSKASTQEETGPELHDAVKPTRIETAVVHVREGEIPIIVSRIHNLCVFLLIQSTT